MTEERKQEIRNILDGIEIKTEYTCSEILAIADRLGVDVTTAVTILQCEAITNG